MKRDDCWKIWRIKITRFAFLVGTVQFETYINLLIVEAILFRFMEPSRPHLPILQLANWRWYIFVLRTLAARSSLQCYSFILYSYMFGCLWLFSFGIFVCSRFQVQYRRMIKSNDKGHLTHLYHEDSRLSTITSIMSTVESQQMVVPTGNCNQIKFLTVDLFNMQ